MNNINYQLTDGMILVGNEICPYCQRAKLAIISKQVVANFKEIDFTKMPAWVESYSPLKKVPFLKTDHGVLFGSIAIINYVIVDKNNLPDTGSQFYKAKLWSLVDLIEDAHVKIRTYLSSNSEETCRKSILDIERIINICTDENSNWKKGVFQEDLNIFILPLLFLMDAIKDLSPCFQVRTLSFIDYVNLMEIEDNTLEIFNFEVKNKLVEFLHSRNSIIS